MGRGKVYITGAGIGMAEYITVRGKEVLDDADVIIFDRLLNDELIRPYKGKKELYYAGKKAGDHFLTQEETNRLMVEKAREGKKVVRLKGGDPYVFGRGGEEGEYVASHGIDVEVIPGVTSGIVALMWAGIPATHRDAATSISFITGHRKDEEKEDFSIYSKVPGTLVFYMGLNNLEKIVRDLIRGGKDPSTPAAVIMNGGYPVGKIAVGTLETIDEEQRRVQLGSPALIVVGDVVEYRKDLNFREKQRLYGKKIVVTRARTQSSRLVKALKEEGATVFEAPTIEVREIKGHGLDQCIAEFPYTHVVFHSVNGEKIFFDHFLKEHDLRTLHRVKLCVIGSATGKILEDYGLKADIVPDRFLGEELVAAIGKDGVEHRKILLPHSSLTSEDLLRDYENLGELTAIPVYESVMPEKLEHIPDDPDALLFTSSSTVENFVSGYGVQVMKKAAVFSIGEKTSEAIRSFGVEPYQSEKATIESLTEKVMEVLYANA